MWQGGLIDVFCVEQVSARMHENTKSFVMGNFQNEFYKDRKRPMFPGNSHQ